MKWTVRALGLSAVATFALSTSTFAAECIAPADAGGGWDFTCRRIGKLLFDLKLVDQPVQVTNLAVALGCMPCRAG